ncbi:MAG: hypothetical protein ACP5VE_03200 [Chthonomonadales bacterium]
MVLPQVPAPLWLKDRGPSDDVVVSSRCRLARNLDGFPFPWRCTEYQLRRIAQAVVEAASLGPGAISEGIHVAVRQTTPEQRAELVTMRYATADWSNSTLESYLIIGSDGATSLLINEEDHVRLQTLLPGLQGDQCLDVAQFELKRLSQSLRFAWKEGIGYLTASPANAGTGMRLSVLVQLMGLTQMGTLAQTLRAARDLGSAVRGVYGENSRPIGALYQISNGTSHGSSVERWAARVSATAAYLVEAERRARMELYHGRAAKRDLADQAKQALELLFEGSVSTAELLWIASLLRLAAFEGVISVDRREVEEWLAIAAAGLSIPAGSPAETAAERFDAIRYGAALRARMRARERGTLPTTNAGLSGRTDM